MKKAFAIIAVLVCLAGCTARQGAAVTAASIVDVVVSTALGDAVGHEAGDLVLNSTVGD
jgi:uncharacterized protein YcfL